MEQIPASGKIICHRRLKWVHAQHLFNIIILVTSYNILTMNTCQTLITFSFLNSIWSYLIKTICVLFTRRLAKLLKRRESTLGMSLTSRAICHRPTEGWRSIDCATEKHACAVWLLVLWVLYRSKETFVHTRIHRQAHTNTATYMHTHKHTNTQTHSHTTERNKHTQT